MTLNLNKKNIWIINQYTGSPYYGMNYRSYYLAREFVEKGHDVTLFSGSYSHLFVHFPKDKKFFTKENIEGIHYVWVKTPFYRNSRSMGRMWNMFIFMLRLCFVNIFKYPKPDIIIISSLSIFPVVNAYIWSKILKVKFIFEVRDMWPLTLIELGGMSRYHPLVILIGLFEKLGYAKAACVVSLLPYSRQYMIQKGMNKDKFHYIPNGINMEEVENYDDVSFEIQQKIPNDKFIVGYLGTMGIANALDTIFLAAKELKNNKHIHFVFVGNGGELKKFQTYTEKNMLENITFIAAIPKKQVQSMLKYFDVCYLGWHKKKIYEQGISANKLFDYMYSATPILHAISTQQDIVKEIRCGIGVDAEDVESLVEAIVFLSLLDKSELELMGRKGKEYVIKYHTYKVLSEKYMTLINKG